VACGAPELVNMLLLPFAVLGGITVFATGLAAALSMISGRSEEQLALAVNRGIALGFLASTPGVLVTFVVVLKSLL
jgi:hypothetical protein